MSAQIIIIDYGMGNLHSIIKNITRQKGHSKLSSNPKEIEQADKLILPGVGHFQKAISNLKELNIFNAINEAVVVKRKPILGICLGMQLMAKKSEEGNADGFGWIDAEVVKFRINDTLRYKIPHTGWNQIRKIKDSPLMMGIPDQSEFYFLHSYHIQTNDQSIKLNETDYEYPFVSAIEKQNIYGIQYHPEKSHDAGDRLIRNFIEL